MSKSHIVGNHNFYFREHGKKYPLDLALSNSDYLRYFYSMWKCGLEELPGLCRL